MENTKKSKMIVFNHFYRLRHDLKRSYILGKDYGEGINSNFVSAGWSSMIHPIYAMFLSIFSKPIKLSDAIKELSYFFDKSEAEVEKLLDPFLENKKTFSTDYEGFTNYFPKNVIIEASELSSNIIEYTPQQFQYTKLDFEKQRPYIAPIGVVFMINNTCSTECIYCYADKNTAIKNIPFSKLKKIIKEADKLSLKDFSITGGEFFVYKEWRKLIDVLSKYNYKPDLLSTKTPLKEEDIIILKANNIQIQISLDSLSSDILEKTLQTKKNYLKKIKDTILLLDKHNVKFQVATVLTKYNDNIENMEKIHLFLNELKNMVRWEIRVAFRSLYSKDNFDDIKTSKNAVSEIESWISETMKSTKINILWSPDDRYRYFQTDEGSKMFKGSRCSANVTNMVILPDGQVTICEQLYWNKQFIIGNISNQSITEIWNSQHALELANPKQENFSEFSACKRCDIFKECYSHQNICIADVIKAYGKQNCDFPDPRCKKAPSFINNLSLS